MAGANMSGVAAAACCPQHCFLAAAHLQETSRRHGSERDLSLYLPDVVQQGANMVMVQLVVGLPATLDLVFLSASGRDSSEPRKQQRLAQLSGARRRTQHISASV
jgi:hypothetical protein